MKLQNGAAASLIVALLIARYPNAAGADDLGVTAAVAAGGLGNDGRGYIHVNITNANIWAVKVTLHLANCMHISCAPPSEIVLAAQVPSGPQKKNNVCHAILWGDVSGVIPTLDVLQVVAVEDKNSKPSYTCPVSP
jgi:hypothetical protein